MRKLLTSAASGAALLACLTFPGPAQADDDTSNNPTGPTEASSGITVYANAYFAPFAPVTALDMVSHVPGFAISDGDTARRGLGDSFGNVLINGARPSNKSLSLDTVLQRIPISEVERIELISEALPEYKMRGHARLVNVVLVQGAGNSGSWDARVAMTASGRISPQLNVSSAQVIGPVELTFGLFANLSGDRVRRRSTYFDSTDTLTEIQHDNLQQAYRELAPSGSLNWQIDDRSSLRVDLVGSDWRRAAQQVSFIDTPSGSGTIPLRYEQNAGESRGHSYDGTATFALALGEGLSGETTAHIHYETRDDGARPYETYDPVSGFLGAVIVESGGD